MMSVFTLSYSLMSSFVTTVFALLEAKEVSWGNVGTFSIVLLDEGALGISITSTDGAETGSGIDGFGAGGGGGREASLVHHLLGRRVSFSFLPQSQWSLVLLAHYLPQLLPV